MFELSVVLASKRSRSPHKIVNVAVPPISVQVDRSVKVVQASFDEVLSNNERQRAHVLNTKFHQANVHPTVLVHPWVNEPIEVVLLDMTMCTDAVPRKIVYHHPFFHKNLLG
jgi:hypothetical protein